MTDKLLAAPLTLLVSKSYFPSAPPTSELNPGARTCKEHTF